MKKLLVMTKKEYRQDLEEVRDVAFTAGSNKGYKEAMQATRDTIKRKDDELATALGLLLRHGAATMSPELTLNENGTEITFAVPEDMIGQYHMTSTFDPHTRMRQYKVVVHQA